MDLSFLRYVILEGFVFQPNVSILVLMDLSFLQQEQTMQAMHLICVSILVLMDFSFLLKNKKYYLRLGM